MRRSSASAAGLGLGFVMSPIQAVYTIELCRKELHDISSLAREVKKRRRICASLSKVCMQIEPQLVLLATDARGMIDAQTSLKEVLVEVREFVHRFTSFSAVLSRTRAADEATVQNLLERLTRCANTLGMQISLEEPSGPKLLLCTINTGRINAATDFLNSYTLEASRLMQRTVTDLFRLPLLDHFHFVELEHILDQAKQSNSTNGWVQYVQPVPRFFEYVAEYLRAAGKDVLPDTELRMRDIVEAFAEPTQPATVFEQIMNDKEVILNDRRILSVPDRIKNRHTIIHDEHVRVSQDDFVARWFDSVNKDDHDIAENINKYLIPRNGELQELGRTPSAEEAQMAYTVAFYLLFVGDYAYSSFPGEYPRVPSQADVDTRKMSALRSVLEVGHFDVVFLQEPLVNLEETLPNYRVFENRAMQTFAAVMISRRIETTAEMIDAEWLSQFSVLDGVLPVILHKTPTNHIALVSVHAKRPSSGTVDEARTELKQLAALIRRHDPAVTRIFAGIDANLDSIPGVPTSVKMRSFLQMQLGKAHLMDKQRKDFIVEFKEGDENFIPLQSTVKLLSNSRFEPITGDLPTHLTIPSVSHPFDHFLLDVEVPF